MTAAVTSTRCSVERDHSTVLNDSGLGSFGSDSDTSPLAAPFAGEICQNSTSPAASDMKTNDDCGLSAGKAFEVVYLGEYLLDRRYTQPMLPWVMAEVRRRNKGRPVKLKVVESATLKAFSIDQQQINCASLFEHKLETMTRFAKSLQDPKCFSYLIRSNSDSAFTCHVYQASEEDIVQQLFNAIRKVTLVASRIRSASVSSDDVHSVVNQLFEVLYIGKVVVSTKKAPPTFIDDAVKKFEEIAKIEKETAEEESRRRHESSASVQSLPANLENMVSVKENELLEQTNKTSSSSDSDEAFACSGEAKDCSNSSIATTIETFESSHGSTGLRAIIDSSRSSLYDDNLDGSRGNGGFPSMLNCRARSGSEACKIAQDTTENLQRLMTHQNLSRKNRTMLIHIGQNELALISLDRKSPIFEWKFKDISFCSQGIKCPEHFGFISRMPESSSFACYIFRCASESVVEEVMMTLKQAFQAAFQQTAKNLVICELCPMHQLHKLCQEIDKLSPEAMFIILQQRIAQISLQDQRDISTKMLQNATIQDNNEIIMAALVRLSEKKQNNHIHINDTKRGGKSDFILTPCSKNTSKFDNLRNLAKKSLANSIDHLLGHHRGSISEENVDARRDRSWTTSAIDADLNAKLPENSSLSPQKPIMEEFYGEDLNLSRLQVERSATEVRQRRHSTPHNIHNLFNSSLPEVPVVYKPEHKRAVSVVSCSHDLMSLKKVIPRDSPIRNMFRKVGNNTNPAEICKASFGPGRVSARSFSTSTASPMVNPRGPYRLSILSKVVSTSESEEEKELEESSAVRKPLSSEKIRSLWRKAILDTLLLIRMNKENQIMEEAYKLELSDGETGIDYEEITPCLKEVTKFWNLLLESHEWKTTKCDQEKLIGAVKDGVPRGKRGDIWQLLVEQHRQHNSDSVRTKLYDSSVSYQELLKQLTLNQHAILIDLGRTFPGHPYFSAPLGPGQLSLFNLLKAYSLLDLEVGYCQGLSFVAGVLLMHIPEENAFEVLKYMMFELGFRRQYRPDMVQLQMRLYQLTRLIHDMHKDLYDHFEVHEIAPTLYAAPWFLTLFASQFPLGFVGRVFDLIFLFGSDVILKVAIILLGNHKELIKQCNSFETIVEFLKTTLPEMGIIQMERIINQVFSLDISKPLEAYEVEYHILEEEMMAQKASNGTPEKEKASTRLSRLQVANDSLRRQKMELLEQLQCARRQIHLLEDENNVLCASEQKLRSKNQALELERAALLCAISKMQELMPVDVFDSIDLIIPSMPESNQSSSKRSLSELAQQCQNKQVSEVSVDSTKF